MRINEITEKNQVFIVLSNMDIDLVGKFDLLKRTIDLLVSQKRKQRLQYVLNHDIPLMNNLLTMIIQIEFPDPTDSDIIALQQTATKMFVEINHLTQQINNILF